MKKMQQAPTTYITDADGQRLAHVALANTDQRATLYAEDLERLLAAGFSRFWKHVRDGRGNAYATLSAYTPEGYMREIPVARLIADAKRRKCVRPNDGNTLNLRLENLSKYHGPARFAAADWYPNVEALRAAGIEPTKGPRGMRKRKAGKSGEGPACFAANSREGI